MFNINRIRVFVRLVTVIAAWFTAWSAFAETMQNSTQAMWVNSKGEVTAQVSIRKEEWVWFARGSPNSGDAGDSTKHFETPSLRLTAQLEMPKGWVLESLVVRGLEIVGEYKGDHIITVDLFSADASVRFRFKDASQTVVENSLAFITQVEKPHVALHKNCEDVDVQTVISVAKNQKGTRNLFYGLQCLKDPTEFVLFSSADAQWLDVVGRDRKLASFPQIVRKLSSTAKPATLDERAEVIYARSMDSNAQVSEVKVLYRPQSWKKTGPPVVSVSTGISYLQYEESFVPDLNQLGLTLKASYTRPFFWGENWDLSVGGYATTVVFSSSIDSIVARYLGLNARVGYNVPQVKAPWKLSLLGGWYYTTMYVSENLLGYRNLQGPQVFPLARYEFNPKVSAYAYAKYAPITIGLKVLSPFQNRELAVGGGANILLKERHYLVSSVDIANLQIAVFGKDIQSTSFSAGIGYSYIFSN